jgi:UTP--glucose-1-phosphate uridylyltransferase
MIQGGGKAYGVCLRGDERRYDIGNFQAYFRAFVEFSLADDKEGPSLRHYLEALLDDHHS